MFAALKHQCCPMGGDVFARLTAPVSVKVSVEVDSDTVAASACRTILPPHSVLRPKKCETQRYPPNTISILVVFYAFITVDHVYSYPSGFITGRM